MIETHIHTPSCKIQAIEDGHEVGLLEFEVRENILTITHTYAYQKGRGIGKMLMSAAIAYAREQHYKILPVCSFARVILQRNEAYKDLWIDEEQTT